MAASKRSTNYLKHLRWVAARLLLTTPCHFCSKPLLDKIPDNREWWNLVRLVTIHHDNGVHEDDAPENLKPAHVACHRRHHVQTRPRRGASDAVAQEQD